ncbi:MAG: DUF4112 domain-containing protein [Bacteroidota bacterium]
MSDNVPSLESPKQLYWIEKASDLLDNKFRIPGTEIRFGIDFIIGLVPYAGDVLTYAFSSVLVLSMARHGASGMVLVKMLWNILVDAIIGSIPILGDLFDLRFRANRRNFELLKEHYVEGEHKGSAWSVILVVLAVLIGLFVLMVWLIFKLASWGWHMLLG